MARGPRGIWRVRTVLGAGQPSTEAFSRWREVASCHIPVTIPTQTRHRKSRAFVFWLWDTWGMFSLQKLLGKDDRFFELLEGAAEEARHSVVALNRALAAPQNSMSMDEFVEARRAEKKIAQQISEALVETFVTTL